MKELSQACLAVHWPLHRQYQSRESPLAECLGSLDPRLGGPDPRLTFLNKPKQHLDTLSLSDRFGMKVGVALMRERFASWSTLPPVVDCPKAWPSLWKETSLVSQLEETPTSGSALEYPKILYYVKGDRSLNNEHVCSSINQSLEERKGEKDQGKS